MTPVPLLCFPPAGAGAGFYHDWRGVRPGLDVHGVELPGREKRFAEPPLTAMTALVDDLVPGILDQTADRPEVVFFGHSFGASVAYEVVRALTAAGRTGLTLIVSGAAAPGTGTRPAITGLPDDEFVAGVRRIAGYRHPALDDPELRELLLPALRADVTCQEQYRPAPLPRLAVPVVALRGAADDLVTATDAARWSEVTDGRFIGAELPGGHMYLVDAAPVVLALVERSRG
ncbi:putative thioesterase [Actinoplanes sp. SE50]|uniref:thioesterase II family protein n=1 Tax=unclassified Actinoplanes TaxID=2626549 RepID=UPI00023EC86E|nr:MULTISPECIES: alpha/beta fold hydrolase [unclassified Actinoplanes]AEV87076.1 putative thioesterase [Actinoplanes sp. SE50/110]ATO85474.1 putative thioesterase [Actinoplanes sp. SE50]SLM02886.1 thioesterase [Actinoplanes sp. SE50/110]